MGQYNLNRIFNPRQVAVVGLGLINGCATAGVINRC